MRIGSYEIEDCIAEGGMGAVYRAIDPQTGEAIALKRLSQLLAQRPAYSLLFREEFRRLKAFVHPNIPKAYELDQDGNVPFFTMELIEGTMLSHVVGLEIPQVLQIFEQMLIILSFVHDRGFVHRDLKPNNFVISPNGRLVLLDLGLMTPVGAFNDGKLRGTPAYIAPELLKPGAMTPASDIYALGVIMYELLTGICPFRGEIADILDGHLHRQPPPLKELRSDLPGALIHIINVCLKKDPAQRYASCSDIAVELAALLGRTVAVASATQRRSVLYTPRLIGRDYVLRTLIRDLDGLTRRRGYRSQPFFTQLAAQPGIGKSRILEEATLEAQVRGIRVLKAVGHEHLTAPFSLIGDAVGESIPLINKSEYNNGVVRLSAFLPIQARLLTDFSPLNACCNQEHEYDANDSLEQLSDERFACIERWLCYMCTERPLLFVLDDVHWADTPSLRCLNRIARECRNLPIGFLLAYRIDELPSNSPILELLDTGLSNRLVIEPFSESSVRELVEATLPNRDVPDDFIHALFHHTGGNAFYIGEVLRTLSDLGSLQGSLTPDLLQIEASGHLADTIMRRVRNLPQTTQQVLRAAAILGGTFDSVALQQLSGLAEEALRPELDKLYVHQILRPVGRTEIAFSHARIAETLKNEIDPEIARITHVKAAEIMEKRSDLERDRIILLAHHFAAGHDERGVEYNLMAAEIALDAGDKAAAFKHFHAAAQLLEEKSRSSQEEREFYREALLEIYDRVLEIPSSLWEDPETCLRYARELTLAEKSKGDSNAYFKRALSTCLMHILAGEYTQSYNYLTKLNQTLEVGSVKWASLQGANFATLHWYAGHYKQVLDETTVAIEILEKYFKERDEKSANRDLLYPLAEALFLRERARAELGYSVDPAIFARIQELQNQLKERANDATFKIHTIAQAARNARSGRYKEVLVWREWAIESSTRFERISWLDNWVLIYVIYGALDRYEIDECITPISRLARSPDPYQRRLALLFKGRMQLAEGHYSEALKIFDQFLSEDQSKGPSNLMPEGLIYKAKAQLGLAQYNEAHKTITKGLELAMSGPLENPLHLTHQRINLAEMYWMTGNEERASQELERAIAIASMQDNPLLLGTAHLAYGRILASQKPRNAEDHFLFAQHSFEEIDSAVHLRAVEAARMGSSINILPSENTGPFNARPTAAPCILNEFTRSICQFGDDDNDDEPTLLLTQVEE